jgi:outer membrane immunogenic protein
MKKFMLPAIAFVVVGMAAPAIAADLPQRMPAAAPAMVMPYVYDWTGFYIGGNGGYGSSRNCWGNFGTSVVAEGCNSRSGGVIGGQAGYRWQAGQFVFGLEAEGDWANLRGSLPSVFFPGTTNSSKVTSLGLFTGQVGFAMNAALFYLKGGAALANNNYLNYNTASGVGLLYASSHKLGGTVGVGFEYGFAPNWSAGIEYDRLFMGSSNNSFSCAAGCAAVVNTISQDIDMVTIRVNYKFGGPVVARY